MKLDELKVPKNNLFKIISRDRHDSPNYTFTWSLTPEGKEILQRMGVRFPFLYVFALEQKPGHKVESHGDDCDCHSCDGGVFRVADELYCLHEGAGQLQFHRPGRFRIFAAVIWTDDARHPTWRSNRSWLVDRLMTNYITPLCTGRSFHAPHLEHVESEAIEIGNSFFAGTPNPTLWWWANLWWEKSPVNTCAYRARLLYFLWLQVIVVPLWVILRGLLVILASLGLLLVGQSPRKIVWNVAAHPFTTEFNSFFVPKGNQAIYDSEGDYRIGLLDVIWRIPVMWAIIPALLYVLGLGLHWTWLSITHHPMAWLIAVGVIVLVVAMAFGLMILTARRRKNSVPIYYTQIPVEPKEKVSYRVRFLDLKGRLCLPYPKV